MLNIFKQKNKNNKKKDIINNSNLTNIDNLSFAKHYPSATKEWCNSIYAYNKNAIKLLPVFDNTIMKLIKSYFNLSTAKRKIFTRRKRLSRKISKRLSRLRKKLKLSTKIIFVSKAELKHTNDKVIITLYIYNQQQRHLLHKLNKINARRKVIRIKRRWRKHKGLKNKVLLRKFKFIKAKGLKIINHIKREKLLLNSKINVLKNKFKYHETRLYKKFIKRSLRKERLKIFYLRSLCFNKRKFENSYLVPLNKLLNNVYNKKVEFNIVKLKYFFLNSDIFSQAITLKIKKKRRLLRVLKASIRIVKIPSYNKFQLAQYKMDTLSKLPIVNKLQSFDVVKSFYNNRPKKNIDVLHQLLIVLKKRTSTIKEVLLRSVKLKAVNGIRLEASGRLSRRFTASRSIFKVKYKGSLKNIDSSYKGLSCVMLRGHAKSNIQYTSITSKTRNGSFGLKGWISSK